MIRIDEIYSNTFWPWLEKNRPGHRLYLCEPFGRSDPDSVINYGRDDIQEHNYIFFFDQEPIHLNMHNKTFLAVRNYTQDISCPTSHIQLQEKPLGYLCTSEKNSANVEFICTAYKWKSLYYFFHGWAALDWYRGYDRTFLITPWQQRKIEKTFLSPNRIIAGERKHRLELLYHIFRLGLTNNFISCPAVCPAEGISIIEASQDLLHMYPDAQEVFQSQSLPLNFDSETDHPMTSCWLDLFDQAHKSLLYLVTETVASGRRLHLTEKTFKPIAMGMPFIIVGTKGSLNYLREYGFKTFEGIWDESYDDAEDQDRIACIASLLQKLDQLSASSKQDLFEQCWPIIEHNWNHFYGGGFEAILWQELKDMLNEIAIAR